MQFDFCLIRSAVCHHFTAFLSNFRNYSFRSLFATARQALSPLFLCAPCVRACVYVFLCHLQELIWAETWTSTRLCWVKLSTASNTSLSAHWPLPWHRWRHTHARAVQRVYARFYTVNLNATLVGSRDSCVQRRQQQQSTESNLGSDAALLWQMRFVIVFGQRRPKWHELHAQRHPAPQQITAHCCRCSAC